MPLYNLRDYLSKFKFSQREASSKTGVSLSVINSMCKDSSKIPSAGVHKKLMNLPAVTAAISDEDDLQYKLLVDPVTEKIFLNSKK